MLATTGIDIGTTERREVSVGLFGGVQDGVSSGRRVVALPSSSLTFRRLALPAAGREVRRQVVHEELAFTLPFPLDEAAWDWTESGSEAWVVVVPLERLEASRRAVEEATALDAEPLAYLRACAAQGIRSALVIDFGASRTTFCAVENGRVDWVRVLLRGGRALTRHLAQARGISPERAETMKCSQGIDLRECAAFVEELLAEALIPEPVPYERILLCGGGSALPGVEQVVTSRLGAEARPFPLPEGLVHTRHVVAYGTALWGRLGAVRVRLQRREAPRAVGFSPLLLAWLALFVVLVTADLEIRHRTLEQKRSALAQVVVEAAAPVVPQAEAMPPGKLVAALKQQIDFARASQQASPRNFMLTLGGAADALQSTPGAEIRSVQYDQGLVTIEGHVTDLSEAQALKDMLAGVFVDLEQVKTRPGAEGTFIYTFEGKLPEP